MKSGIRLIALVPVLYIALAGCATITRGTTEAFVVKTDPSGADVRLSSGETCTSPCTLEKDRDDEFVVFIEKPGYQPMEVNVLSQVAGAGAAGMAGNIIFGGLIGAAIDASSGAMMELVPNPIDVVLNPATATNSISAAPGTKSRPIQVVRHHNQAEREPATLSDVLIPDLIAKSHTENGDSNFIWLVIEWRNSEPDRTIHSAKGELQINQKDTDKKVLVPWSVDRILAPGEALIQKEYGFEVKNAEQLKWLIEAERSALELKFVPSNVVFIRD